MSKAPKPTLGLRERKKAKTMSAIQTHAMRLFREFGYQATTVEQIAEAAEVSPSTFFRYFPTKEDVVIQDNYDPMLIAAFEEQPPHLSPIQAIRAAILSALSDISPDQMQVVRERTALILTVQELRAAYMNNMLLTIQIITEMLAKRVGRSTDDLGIQTFAGAVVGACMSVFQYQTDHPATSFPQLLDEAMAHLENGLNL